MGQVHTWHEVSLCTENTVQRRQEQQMADTYHLQVQEGCQERTILEFLLHHIRDTEEKKGWC